jgi:predicted nucleic acid-binding protein
MVIQNASLDTSFWVMASQIGVVPYLFDFFRIHYCQAVASELITTDPEMTTQIYPQAMLFQVMRDDGRLHLAEPENPLHLFVAGEAHAMALARERSWVLLINDSRPLQFAQTLGILCVSVPEFCVLLYTQGKITEAAAFGYLKRLRSTTSPRLLNRAEQVVNEFTRSQNRDSGTPQ